MEIHPTPTDVGGDGPAGRPLPELTLDDAASKASEQVRAGLWRMASLLYRRKWTIVAVALLTGIAAVFITLRLPNQYRAETKVLIPDASGGLMSSMLGSLSPAAAALLGGSGSGFTRYLAILSSREMLGAVVDRFDLIEVYDLGEEENPREEAMAELAARASFEVSLEYDFLSVSVLDPSPTRAAQIANFFVERLNLRHVELTSRSASQNRRFLEERLEQANLALDSAQADLQGIQERYGVIEPEAQASALMAALGQAQGQVGVAEAQYQALRAQYGDENPDVAAARAAVASARQQVARLSGGSEAVMPVPIQRLPQVQRQYAEAMQGVMVQRRIIEEVQPLYEQAALQEQRETDAVQVLDVASPPARKAEPRRSLLVLGATFSAALIACAVVLLLGWMRQNGRTVLARLRTPADA